MSIKLNTTRPLHKLVQRDLKRFQNIRFFIVDFNIFGAAPPRTWAEFNKLEKLTIAIYPHKTISNLERPLYTDEPSFIRPHRCYTHAKRAVWLQQAALDLLQSVKDHDVPQWKIPDVEVVVRRTGREDADDDIQEEWVDEDISDEEYYDMEELTDDSVWYEQAAKVLAKNVPHAELKRLKRKFHRSRLVRYNDPQDLKGEREPGTYYTDSEMESGGKVDEYESD
jgi:hypothetical protein